MAKRLHIVEEKFLNTIKQNNLISKGDKIVVGVSGGPDSITLLTCLNKYKDKFGCEIIVAHVNHLLRKESTSEEQFVENVCKNLNIKFFAKRVDINKLSKEKKRGTEETAREERYNFFEEILKKEDANKIAIAHNMNDNAETMLLNLIRGTGLTGLEGIKPIEYDKFIRPLINCKREEIEEYCKINNLEPRIDKTNFENVYTRNKVRNIIIPQLKEINPNVIETLSRTSEIITYNNEYIRDDAEKVYKKIANESKEKIEISIKDFNMQQSTIKKEIIILAIKKIQGNLKNIEKVNIDDIEKLATKNVGGKYIKINKHITAKTQKGEIIFLHQSIA